MDCKTFQSDLPELLLDPASASNADARAHMAECAPCERQYASFVASMAVMDLWQAPEPSPYFDQKLAVLLREEIAAPKLGFFGRLKEHLLFNTGRQFRPAVAGIAVFILMLGGGSYVSLEKTSRVTDSQTSAIVNDLQILDKNEQALQQMDQLLQEEDNGDDSTANAPS